MNVNVSGLVWLTFGLLALSIVAVWFRDNRDSPNVAIPAWGVCYSAAVLCGLGAGVLRPWALFELFLFLGVAYLFSIANPNSVQRYVFGTLTTVLAVLLAVHRLPGFLNPVIFFAALSPNAPALTQYANFDKGSVGLVLLAFVCQRTSSIVELSRLFRQTVPLALMTVAIILFVAVSIGYTTLDPKFTSFTVLFLPINLFFTVVAEEAFFRGFLQERIAQSLSFLRFGRMFSIAFSALLFGVAHAAGGLSYVLLASLLGFGCAYGYFLTRRIETPIIIHFALNTVHCIGFTYPYLN